METKAILENRLADMPIYWILYWFARYLVRLQQVYLEAG
jgi:hypothetical protein